MQRMIEIILRAEGFRVITADNEPEAKQVVTDLPIRLVLSCWRLGTGTAQGFLEFCLGEKPDLKLLVLSGGNPQLPSGWAFLSKPCKPSELLDAIRRICPDCQGL